MTMLIEKGATYEDAWGQQWVREDVVTTMDGVWMVPASGGLVHFFTGIEIAAGALHKVEANETKESDMSETSIRVKKGQRWRNPMTSSVISLTERSDAFGGSWRVTVNGCSGGLLTESDLRTMKATLIHDPDEGDAPEVGSRWVRDFEGDELTVVGIVGTSEGTPGVRLSDHADKTWYFCSFREGGVHSPAPVPASPSLDEYEAKARKLREHDAKAVAQVHVGDVFRCLRTTDRCRVVGFVTPRMASISMNNRPPFAYPVSRLLNKLAYEHIPAKPARFDKPPTGPNVAVEVHSYDGNEVTVELLTERQMKDRQRAKLLEHWMSLRPDDLHEGGWRRVGVGLISDPGHAGTTKDLGTLARWFCEELAGKTAVALNRLPCMGVELRLYTEEAERGKWWR